MAIEIKHKFQSSVPDGADSSIVRPSNWNDTHDIEMAGQSLLGRSSSGTGVAQEVTLGDGLEFSSGAIVVRLGTGLTFAGGAIESSGFLPLAGGTMTGPIDMGGHALINVDWDGTPVGLSGVPIGAVLFDPRGVGWPGFLEANGSSFNTSTYPDLALLYPSGVLPDFRDRVPRGAGTLAGAAGTYQNDAMQRITGTYTADRLTHGGGYTATRSGAFLDNGQGSRSGLTGSSTGLGDSRIIGFNSGNSPGARVSDDETRVKAIIGKWYIKAHGAFTNSGLADLVAMEQSVNEALSGIVVESGSNANGFYRRFADGIQECWGRVSITPVANTPTSETWTYPAAFSSPPIAVATTTAEAAAMVRPAMLNPVYETYLGVNIVRSNTTGTNNHIYATGRWF